MKKLIHIAFILVPIFSFAQIDYINQQELYVKYNVDTVISISHYNNKDKHELFWVLDSLGRIIYQEYFPSEKNSIPDKTYWYYNDNLVSEVLQYASWSTKNEKIDTAKTIYFYNNSNILQQTQYTNTRNSDTITTLYKYKNKLLNSNHIYVDNYYKEYSLFTYDSVSLINTIKESETFYFKYDNNFVRSYKTEREFNYTGDLIKESLVALSPIDTSYTTTSYVWNFKYKDKKLVKIKEVYFSNNKNKSNEKYVTRYKYNAKGLVSKTIEIDKTGDKYIISYIYK